MCKDGENAEAYQPDIKNLLDTRCEINVNSPEFDRITVNFFLSFPELL